MRSTLLAVTAIAAFFAAVFIAHAHESDCSSATQRDAMAEYDTIAGMVGIPAGAPIYTLERRQYIAAVCLHEELRSR
jgi:hypothetical protein